MKTTQKQHIISACITFIVAFSLSIATSIGDTTIALSLENSALLAIVATALRAGVKELITYSTTLIQ